MDAKRAERGARGNLPLSHYAIIGDGTTAALVARDGSIDWLCVGRFDGPAVFCRLLDAERGGHFQVAPTRDFEATRRYAENTNVLETEFECATGRVLLTDAMWLGSDRGPVVLRRLRGLSGAVELRVDFAPTFDFVQQTTTLEVGAEGCIARGGGRTLRLSCPAPLSLEGNTATARVLLRAGEDRWLCLSEATPLDASGAEHALRSTLEQWRRWSEAGEYPGPYAGLLRRSALVLKVLIHARTGGIVAAPTTSLPEALGGARNWDYRFTWLRDASWLVSALMDLGYHAESMAFIDWLESLELDTGRASIFYDLDGQPPQRERELWHLAGYCGSRPVRVGNAAAHQKQHDIYGEVIAAIRMCSDAMPSMRPLRPGLWKLVSALAEAARQRCDEPDHGLWEVRDRPRHFVSSKVFCWAALDGAIAIAQRDGLGALPEWDAARQRLRQDVLTAGFDERRGAFRRAYGERGLDAAALLFPRYGILPATDSRLVQTADAVQRELASGALIRRYLGDDGLSGSEGAFTACSFWLVDCLVRRGRLHEAQATFEQVVAHANDVGLLSEQIDPDTGLLLGNYPQAFTHLALVRAAVALSGRSRVSATK